MKSSWPSIPTRLVHNTLALYVVQFAEYLLPMLTVPYLSRLLGSEIWGLVIYTQSFAGWLGILLEYGFNMSATRRLAKLQTDQVEERANVVAGVFGASVFLILISLAVALVCAFSVPLFVAHRDLLLLGTLIALAQGVRPFWYFQGTEKLALISAINLVGRVFTTAGVFLLVRTDQDAWLVLLLQLLSAFGMLVFSIFWVYRETPMRHPSLSLAIETLREGWGMFVMRSSISLYTLANTFILGLFASAQQVAFYGGPERLNKAAMGVMQPLISVLYPRMNHLVAHDRANARHTVFWSLILIGGLGVVLALGMGIGAPWMIRILGQGYEPAIPVFRVMALLAPLIAVNSVLGAQWLIPLGYDHQVNRIIISAGLLNLCAAWWAASRFGAIGMAYCVVGAEIYICIALLFTVQSLGESFWNSASQSPKR